MVMRLRIPSPNWTDPVNPGKCIEFPPTRGDDPFFDDQLEAVQLCNGDVDGLICPLRHDCLIFALVNNCADGVWGGMLEHDRKNLRRHVRREDWGWHPPTDPEEYDPEDEDLEEDLDYDE